MQTAAMAAAVLLNGDATISDSLQEWTKTQSCHSSFTAEK
jgi:hypothetical protein